MKKSLYRLFRFSYVVQQWLTQRFTNTGLAMLVGLVLSAAVGLDTNESMAYQIFTFLLATLGVAIASSLSFRDRFSVTRILPKFGTVGVPLKYRLLIHNPTRQVQTGLKLFETFADPRPSFAEFLRTPEPSEAKRHPIDRALGYYRWLWLVSRKRRAIATPADLPPLKPRQKTEAVVELLPTHRGVVRFTGLKVARPDPFGLFHAWSAIALPQSLLILPKLYQLPPICLPGLRRYQSGGVALASSVGDSEEFMSLRDYRPGDPLRKIHWKSWAKVGKPVVREEQDEFFVRHALILDTFQPTPDSEVLEAAVSVAASFACEVQTQESLLDLMFVGPEAYCFTFGRGLSHTDRMLEILASVGACQDKSFDSLRPLVIDRLSLLSGCICVLLTWDDDRKQLVSHLQAMRLPTLVLVITDEETHLAVASAIGSQSIENLHILQVGNLQAGLMQL